MKKSIIYFLIGCISTFLVNHFVFYLNENIWVDLYYSFAFGLGWGLAYFVDRPDWNLAKKMGISFVGIAVILLIGLLIFNFEVALPSIIRFSTVFVAYYLFASFRENKTLRK